MFRTITFRLRPNKAQAAAFEHILVDSCETYNAALQERKEAWNLRRKYVGMFDQYAQLAQLRKDKRFATVAAEIQRDPVRRVERAFNGFFQRCKAGRKPGFPRFLSLSRYDSFGFGGKIVIENDRIRVPKLGFIKFRSHCQLIGKPKFATVKRNGKRWVLRLSCDVGPAPEKCIVERPTGIDLGISKFVTLSDGTAIENPRHAGRHELRVAAANRLLVRKQKHSKNRLRAKEVLHRAHQKATNARRNFTHHVSRWLVSNYDLIAYEKLKIQEMVRSSFAKPILETAWGELIWQISYKAESAGRWAIPINPRGTSIRCSQCGAEVRKTLRERKHLCPKCGLVLDRDHNAALNILALGKSVAGLLPFRTGADDVRMTPLLVDDFLKCADKKARNPRRLSLAGGGMSVQGEPVTPLLCSGHETPPPIQEAP